MISGLWKDDLLQKCEMKYIQLPVNTLGSSQTPNFSNWLLTNLMSPRMQWPPGAHSNSPINGLESSALFLQLNTVLIFIYILYIYISIYIFTSSTIILFVGLKIPKTGVAFSATGGQTTSSGDIEDDA